MSILTISSTNTLLSAALPSGAALHQVAVGAHSQLLFDPPTVNAPVGDVIQFTFHSFNHTLTQSSLDSPCTPLNGGFSTGFNEYNAPDTSSVQVSFTVNSPYPQFFFCAQDDPAPHCFLDEVFAINAGPSYNTFISNVLQQGPFTNLLSSLTAETVTTTESLGSSHTTLTNIDIPTANSPEPAPVVLASTPASNSSKASYNTVSTSLIPSLPPTTSFPTATVSWKIASSYKAASTTGSSFPIMSMSGTTSIPKRGSTSYTTPEKMAQAAPISGSGAIYVNLGLLLSSIILAFFASSR